MITGTLSHHLTVCYIRHVEEHMGVLRNTQSVCQRAGGESQQGAELCTAG